MHSGAFRWSVCPSVRLLRIRRLPWLNGRTDLVVWQDQRSAEGSWWVIAFLSTEFGCCRFIVFDRPCDALVMSTAAADRWVVSVQTRRQVGALSQRDEWRQWSTNNVGPWLHHQPLWYRTPYIERPGQSTYRERPSRCDRNQHHVAYARCQQQTL